MSERTSGRIWTRDDTIFALALYFQLPYGQLDARTPKVIEMARLIGRSPASLSMKMCNLARLDPTLQNRQISGLSHGAKFELEIWNEFYHNQDKLADEFNRLISALTGHASEMVAQDDLIKTPPGLDGMRLTKYRINQSFFRRSVLSAYDNRCCVTGINVPSLLIASHIKPWARCEEGNEKTNAQNGLCLNALHDKAFDKGFMTIDTNMCVRISPRLKDTMSVSAFNYHFGRYDGQRLIMPERCPPDEKFLSFHRENVYVA